MTPDQVSQITNTLSTELEQSGGNHMVALEATAAQRGLPVEQVQALVAHTGMSDQLEQYARGPLKS